MFNCYCWLSFFPSFGQLYVQEYSEGIAGEQTYCTYCSKHFLKVYVLVADKEKKKKKKKKHVGHFLTFVYALYTVYEMATAENYN